MSEAEPTRRFTISQESFELALQMHEAEIEKLVDKGFSPEEAGKVLLYKSRFHRPEGVTSYTGSIVKTNSLSELKTADGQPALTESMIREIAGESETLIKGYVTTINDIPVEPEI